MESAKSNWTKYVFVSIGILALFIIYQFSSSPMVVTVSGVGDISSDAKTATLTFSLVSNKDNPQSATSEVKLNINKIRETLKTSGISESDIYESQIAVYPASAVNAGATGFQATSSMGFRTTQVNNLDGLTSTLYSLGALVVTQPVLEVGDKEKLEKEAYDLALKDAKKKANSIALSNFKFIKKIILIQEATTTPTTSTVTSKPSTVTQVEKNLSADAGIIKISKVLSVSYKMW